MKLEMQFILNRNLRQIRFFSLQCYRYGMDVHLTVTFKLLYTSIECCDGLMKQKKTEEMSRMKGSVIKQPSIICMPY